MKIHIWQQDVAQQLAERRDPVSVLWAPREGTGGVWRILQCEVSSAGVPDTAWSLDRHSPQIRIPMFPYRLADPRPGTLVHFGAQLTTAILCGLMPRGQLQEFVLVRSDVYARDDGKPGYMLWAGIAVNMADTGG